MKCEMFYLCFNYALSIKTTYVIVSIGMCAITYVSKIGPMYGV